MKPRVRFLVSALVASVLFTGGYFVEVLIPGAGGPKPDDFTSFYNSDAKMSVAILLFFVLVLGCLALVWFFNELRIRLPETQLTRIAYSMALIGIVTVPAGAGVMAGPLGAQQNSDSGFVGVPVAQSIAQSGLFISLGVGMTAFALAALLMSLAARRESAFPKWLTIAGIVLGILTLGSFFWIPGLAFPVWVLLVGIGGMRSASVTERPGLAPMRAV
jgi:Domain of unknown function (DUF4386)